MFVRRAIPAELPAIAVLVNEAYRGEAAAASWTSEAAFIAGQRTSAALLREELANHPQRRILTLREARGGPLLACVMLDRVDAETLTLGLLSVSPNAQNKGLGKRLIAAGETFGRETGARRLRITVIQIRTALLAWYERQGFVRTGSEAFPYGDQRFGVPLRDDLYFVVLDKPIG